MALSRQSSQKDVILFLKRKNFHDIVEAFEANEVDGEDFFKLDMRDIHELIPRLKTRKKFLVVWTEVTYETFDVNGIRCPLDKTPKPSKALPISPTFVPSPTSPIMHLPSPCSVAVGERKSTSSLPNRYSQQRSRKALVFDSDRSPLKEMPKRSPRKLGSSFSSRSNSTGATAGLISSKENLPTVASPVCNEPPTDWLKNFSIATRWAPDIEQGLSKGELNPLQKSALVRQLCATIMAPTSHPSSHIRNHIAILLVQKYPFLKASFGTGHQFWAKKIEDRILNLRRLASRNEKRKFKEDGVEMPKGKPGRKKGKSCKSPALPAIPDGETIEMHECQRKELMELFRKSSQDLPKVKLLMDNTFVRRRRDTLSNSTRVWKLLQDYPFLKDTKGIEMRAELTRILCKDNVIKNMRGAWEEAKSKILNGLKKCTATEVHSILALMEDCTVVNEKEMENRCILAALPHVLGEKKSHKQKVGEHFWEIVNEDITDDTMSQKVKACSSPKLMSTGSIEYLDSLTLISEGMVVAKYKTTNILNAVICLIASYYVFNEEYPKGANGHAKNIYLFLEHILIGNKELCLPMGVENFITSL